MMFRRTLILLMLPLALLAQPSARPYADEGEAADLRAARELFEANLSAIRNRNRDAYLALYLNSPTLARTGPEGFVLGYDSMARGAGENWPDTFEGRDLQLVRIQPGVVYGTYRYRVRYGADEHSGISERLFVKTPAGWKIAVTTAFDNPLATPPAPMALLGGTLIDGTGAGPVRDAVVVIRGGRIDCAGSRQQCEVPPGVTVIDAKGKWITPGLIDAHVHFSQTGWADGRPDALDVRDRYPYEKTQAELKERPDRFFRSYLCSGVTSVFDVGGYPWTLELAEQTETDRRAPHVTAAGPLLSTLDHWVNLPAERQFIYLKDEASAREAVRYLAAQGSGAVKVWYIVPSDGAAATMAPLVLAAGEEARRAGLPLIVHATGLDEAKIAARAGAHLFVHSVWDRAVDQEFIDLLLRNKAVYVPTLTVVRGYLRMFDSAASGKAPVVDDPNGCVDPRTRAKLAETGSLGAQGGDPKTRAERTAEQERISAANLKRLHDAGVIVAMGTDAGNPLTLHGPSVYGEMEAMQRAGLSPAQVVVAATRGAALAMRRDKDLGTVEKGKIADLLVLDADPLADVANFRKLRSVIRGGVMRSIEELRAVAASEN